MAGHQEERSDLVAYVLTCTVVLALIGTLHVVLHV
jgi:hypothetical protein